jgi:hypothetical protein
MDLGDGPDLQIGTPKNKNENESENESENGT